METPTNIFNYNSQNITFSNLMGEMFVNTTEMAKPFKLSPAIAREPNQLKNIGFEIDLISKTNTQQLMETNNDKRITLDEMFSNPDFLQNFSVSTNRDNHCVISSHFTSDSVLFEIPQNAEPIVTIFECKKVHQNGNPVTFWTIDLEDLTIEIFNYGQIEVQKKIQFNK